MIGKIFELLFLSVLAAAQGNEPINQKTPYCNFNAGIKMTMDPNDELLLPFTVAWADTVPKFVLGKWACFYWGKDRQKYVCPEAQKNIALKYEKGFNSGNFTIASNTFSANDSINLHLTISELKTNVQYLCGINIKVQPEGTENVPLTLHSDVPFNTHITMEDDHQFSCDIDYKNVGALSERVINQQVKYEVKMYDLRNQSDVPVNADFNEHENAMLVSAEYFRPNRVYAFRCQVNFEIEGAKYNGKAWKLFNTRFSEDQPIFTITPNHGTPFSTKFTLNVDKSPALAKLKCEFGYHNSIGKVVMPTKDTGDYLMQSKQYATGQSFNEDNVTLTTAFPPNTPSNLEDEIMVVYAQCWNQYGQAKILKEVITLDNSQIEIDDALVQDLLKAETYDLNSILLVADAFITTRQGLNNPHNTQKEQKPYHNHALFTEVVKKTTSKIMQVETDSMDLHKTKQLAWVMYILTERSLNEDAWEGQDDVNNVVADMVTATTNLIMANQFIPPDAQSSLAGQRNTIPIDMEGFTWLAKTTDNLILHSMLMVPPENQQAIKLKTDFFRFALYRLAGGLDNSRMDDAEPIRGVRTQSFTVELMKFSAANMIDIPIKFEIDSSSMQDNMNERGKLIVELPADRSIFESQNVLVAVMYSAVTGEETVNYMDHPEDDYQFEFLSGVVKVEVASTPQAFGTDKICQVWDKEVKNLTKPVTIRLPVSHSEMKGLGASDLINSGVKCAYQNDWEANWQELNQKCPQSLFDDLKKEEFVCCSDHLTSFSVYRPTDVSGGHIENTYVPIASIYTFLVVFLIIGVILDFKGKLIVDQQNKTEKKIKLPEATGAAAAENENEQNAPADKGQNDDVANPDDIKVQLEQVAPQISDKPAAIPEPEDVIADSCKDSACCKAWLNSLRYYHRIGNLIYSSSVHSSRPVKTMNTTAQLCMAMAIACGVIAAAGQSNSNAKNFAVAACPVAFAAMRLVQPLFNYMESLIGRSSKMGNIICFMFFLLVSVVMQVIIGISLYQPFSDKNVVATMLQKCQMILLIELVIWDFCLMPIILSCVATCDCGKKFFSSLLLPVTPC